MLFIVKPAEADMAPDRLSARPTTSGTLPVTSSESATSTPTC